VQPSRYCCLIICSDFVPPYGWRDGRNAASIQVADLLKPFDSREMRVYPVSSAVSSLKNDGPECTKETPVATAEILIMGVLHLVAISLQSTPKFRVSRRLQVPEFAV